MPRNNDYQFIPTDTSTIVSQLISAYERIVGLTVHPASPERLFIQWIADVIIKERVLNNYTGNQNLPSRAEGQNLDALGELFFLKERPPAKPSVCTMRFYISEAQESAVLIPIGTQVTGTGIELIWQTTADAYISEGNTYVDVMVECMTAGVIGNGYAIGQINTIVEPYAYYDKCENITETDAGSDVSSDEEYFNLMRESQDAFSNAGAKGGYIYFAKQVSIEISDVVANTPSPGQVNLYILMNDGTAAGTEIKNAVLAACNDDFVRPLTDYVVVEDPEPASYDIQFTYYIPNNLSLSASEVESAVNDAVDQYIKWQNAKLGRDINPSYLMGLLMQTGIKRVDLVYPEYASLSDGSDNTAPEIAIVDTITITNGGYENE